jgi:ligand-binding sensor protein
MAQKKKGHGGTKKYGRNRIKCQKYRSENRREKSKLRKVEKYNGKEALAKYKETIYRKLV